MVLSISEIGELMAGIYGIFSKDELNTSNIYNYFYSSTLDNIINEEYKYNNFLYGRSVVNKFLDDRVLYEDNSIIIGFEGVFYNKKDEKSVETIKDLYYNDNFNFAAKIKGQFCGFIFDKRLDKLYIYNDHLSTKPLYVYKNKDIFIFASELKVVTGLLSQLKIKKELDYDAIYSMLTFGYMLDDITYEKNTKKLKYARILTVDNSLEIEENQYFKFKKKEDNTISKEEIINKIDDLLISSIKDCWNKDKEYNYKHYSFLSGGLDSRVNVFLAKELGYNDILTMTFSQSGSSDDKIAQEISSKENFEHLFYSLDNGKFLEKNLEKYILANDGLNNLSGSASGYKFLSTLNHNNYGALHTGQIGDVLFGSFIKNNYKIESGMITNQFELIKKISFIEKIKNKYNNNPEIYSYEQRQPNSTLNGDITASHFTDMLSPFYNRDLIEFCLTIPDKYKKDEKIYLDWFNSKHKNISNYIWEGAGIKPNNINYVKIAKIIKRYKNGILRRLGFNINDMNPFDVWLRTNKDILENLDLEYSNNIDKIKDKELKNILISMYNSKVKYSHYGRNNKFLVITLLLALNLHFGEENETIFIKN
ncbi:MAG: hypothetical protein DRG78_10525 [Epsilonproteobacteria bacterium]|nr:MAG: hypothetical protein DRG78_10525 [Campylobacterota bacterium]